MSNLANIEDPDEMQQMQHNAAFHQGLHCCLIRLKQSSGTDIHHNIELILFVTP